jgi:hypothetical protein
VIGGDFNASHSTVLGDSNEQRMLVLGSIIETGRVVQGEHSIGAQIRLEDHTAPQSIRRPILEYEVDLSELEREARLTASGDRISLGMKIDVDLSALEANTDTERFPTDPTTLRSVTAEQLQSWRDALQGAAAELLREKDDRGLLEVRSLRPSREPRASVASPRPGAASRPKYLADKQAQPRARVRRDSLRPPPAAVEPVEPRRSHPPRTRRGASRGQRPPLSLRSIDKGWDELSQDD